MVVLPPGLKVYWSLERATFTPVTSLRIPQKWLTGKAITPQDVSKLEAFVNFKVVNPNDFQVDFEYRVRVSAMDRNYADSSLTRARSNPLPELYDGPPGKVETIDLLVTNFPTIDGVAKGGRLGIPGVPRKGLITALVDFKLVAGSNTFSLTTTSSAILWITYPPILGPTTIPTAGRRL